MEKENRRGFLKTLGKLTAAVGITAAAATSLPAKDKGIGDPGPLASIKVPWSDNHSELPAKQIKYAANICVTNRKGFHGNLGVGKSSEEAQRTIDALHNARIDNIRMSYNYFDHDRALKELDPYNWQKVYTLDWEDWKPRDPSRDTLTGVWLATVKPQFASCFEKPCYYRSVTVGMHTLRMGDAMEIKRYAQDNGFREIVRSLQDEILDRIKRDVRSRS